MNEPKTDKQRARLEKKLDAALEKRRIANTATDKAVKELADYEAKFGVDGDAE